MQRLGDLQFYFPHTQNPLLYTSNDRVEDHQFSLSNPNFLSNPQFNSFTFTKFDDSISELLSSKLNTKNDEGIDWDTVDLDEVDPL